VTSKNAGHSVTVGGPIFM